MDDPRIDAVLEGRYRVVERLAQGGMGAVYKGERIGLGREVAIKFLHEWAAAEPSLIKRFELEAHAMAKLQHANCAQVIDVGVISGSPFVVMELVAGRPLSTLLDHGPLPPTRAIEIVRQVLAALDHAHGHGIIHRDIKPANIVVASSEEFGDQVKVLDFGLAKFAQTSSTLTGAFAVGTPTYIPPEQSRGEAVDGRTDLYSLGVVLFELLTGAPPFLRDDAAELIDAHRSTLPPRLADRHPGGSFSEALERVTARALAKRPDDRYASAAEMARALEAVPEARPRVATPPPIALAALAGPRPAEGTMMLGSEALLPADPPPIPEWPSIGAPPPSEIAPPRPSPSPPPTEPAWKQLLAGRRRWIAAAAGVALLAVILIAVIVGGGGKPHAPPTVPDQPPPEIDMTPTATDSPELAKLRARVRGTRTSDDVMRALQRLANQEPTNAEIPLLLGQIYCERLWVSDCLPAFRKAIAIDPALRDDPRLIGSAVYGLGNDRAHGEVRRFLVRDIGAAAIPALEEVVRGRWRKDVKDRAAAALGELGATIAP